MGMADGRCGCGRRLVDEGDASCAHCQSPVFWEYADQPPQHGPCRIVPVDEYIARKLGVRDIPKDDAA